jgi:hypothetical protein
MGRFAILVGQPLLAVCFSPAQAVRDNLEWLSYNTALLKTVFYNDLTITTCSMKAVEMRCFQNTRRLLNRLMLETLKGMIVLADKFEDVPSGPQLVAQLGRPGLRVTFGIVKCEVDLQCLIVHSMNALDDVHLIAFRVTQTIQPNLSV